MPTPIANLDSGLDVRNTLNEVIGLVSGTTALTAIELQHFLETSPAASVSGAVTRDRLDGPVHALTLTGNVTSLAISNPAASGKVCSITFIIIQDGGGTNTWAHPTGTDWPGGVAPTLTTGGGDVSILTYVTRDAGTTWFGFEGGVDFG